MAFFCLLIDCFPLQLDYCSHMRSIELFVESMLTKPNQKAFPAVRCAYTTEDRSTYECLKFSKTINYMGFYAAKSPVGKFYLKTNLTAPYNAGVAGYENLPSAKLSEN